jgi:carbonic anhydrase
MIATAPAQYVHAASPDIISAGDALQRLLDGNQRFTRGETLIRGSLRETFSDLAQGQEPFATILSCSDSRVPPELVFDAGIDELFVIRVAGNVFSPEVARTLLHDELHLNTQLFVVLGHEGCEAVADTLNYGDLGGEPGSCTQILIDNILPAQPPFDPELSSTSQLAQAVERNVRRTVRTILNTPEGRARIAKGLMKLVGAIYEISTRKARFLPVALP